MHGIAKTKAKQHEQLFTAIMLFNCLSVAVYLTQIKLCLWPSAKPTLTCLVFVIVLRGFGEGWKGSQGFFFMSSSPWYFC